MTQVTAKSTPKQTAPGQVALVTGSSRGIGLAAALALAHKGFAIAVNGRTQSPQLEAARTSIADIGVPVYATAHDIADLAGHDTMLEAIETNLGPLTTLVNNAGVSVMQRGDMLDVSQASYDRCMAVNAKAMFFLTQAVAKRILSRPRHPDSVYSIINVTSSNAVAVAAPRAEYCASKAAAAMQSKAFAVRLAGEGIYVYDVQPGLIKTDMTAPALDHYQQRVTEGLTLVPRLGTSEEIGGLIANLATGGLPYTTGQAISADGGMLVPRF